MLPVTCTIIAMNEADRIAHTIQSVNGLVSEVLVIDGGSSDDTVAVCERLGARVIHNPWHGFGPQKRLAEDQASHDWILNLDADEYLSPELCRELAQLLKSDIPNERAFRTRIRVVYPGHDMPTRFADYHNYIRLYNRTSTRFRNSLTHDEVLPTDDVVQLRGEILHRSYRAVSHIVRKFLDYAELQKAERGQTRKIGALRIAFELPFQFFKYYILRRHVFGGRAGFVYAMTLAVSRWLRLVMIAGW